MYKIDARCRGIEQRPRQWIIECRRVRDVGNNIALEGMSTADAMKAHSKRRYDGPEERHKPPTREGARKPTPTDGLEVSSALVVILWACF